MSTDAIGFNNIPGSGLVAPIFTAEVNSGGQYTSQTRLVLFGHATAAGNIAANTPTPVFSQNDADVAAGPGSMLREMFRIAAQNAPAQPIWLCAVVEPAGNAEVRTLTIGALPGLGTGVLQIEGETIQVGVGATDTPTTVAAAIAAAINAYYNPLTGAMLPLTATSAAAVVTVTMRHKGAIMSDVDIYVPTNITNNILAASGVFTQATTTAGSGTPDLSAPLAALADNPADFIASPWSDTVSLGDYTEALNDVSGRWAWLRQSYGHVWTVNTNTTSALVTLGLTLNDRHTTIIPRPLGTGRASWLWAAAVTARLAPWLSDCVTGNVSRNQTGLIVQGLAGPRNNTLLWNYSARNTLLNSGISTWTVTPNNQVAIDKIITTYRTGTSGQPDSVFRDVQAMYQASGGLAFLRATLLQAHGTKALANSNPGNLAAISTPSDIKATFIGAYRQLCDQGVFQDADSFAQMVVVQINAENPARVDCYVPIERVNPLDILAANATFYQQYPASAVGSTTATPAN